MPGAMQRDRLTHLARIKLALLACLVEGRIQCPPQLFRFPLHDQPVERNQMVGVQLIDLLVEQLPQLLTLGNVFGLIRHGLTLARAGGGIKPAFNRLSPRLIRTVPELRQLILWKAERGKGCKAANTGA